MSRRDRITSDPEICHGQPTVRGLRYPVENLLELLASGMTIAEFIQDHPDLERDDLLAALEFGALAASQRRVVPLGAACGCSSTPTCTPGWPVRCRATPRPRTPHQVCRPDT